MKLLINILILFLPLNFLCAQKTSSLHEGVVGKYTGSGPIYIVSLFAVANEKSAQIGVEKLKKEGYEAGYLWIPDFASLSGAKYFTIFLGPYLTQKECETKTDYFKTINPAAFGQLVSQEKKSVEIHGENQVVEINKTLWPNIDEEKELVVKLAYVQTGNDILNIGLDPIVKNEIHSILTFAIRNWHPLPESPISNMNEILRDKQGTFFKIKIKYSAIIPFARNRLEANAVKTGKFENDWVLTYIERLQ